MSDDMLGNFAVLPSIEFSADAQNWTAFDFSNPQTVTLAKVGFEEWGTEESRATYGWLSDVSPEGTFECPEGLEIKYGENYIPEGWTVETR